MTGRPSSAADHDPAPAGPGSRTETLTRLFVSWPSVTGSADERAFAGRLFDLLAGLPLFANAEGNLVRVPAPNGDAPDSVVGLVRGGGRGTLVLAGHFDTVGIENYGALSSLACDPDALLAALQAELGLARTPAEQLAARDFAGGDFLPGRGVCDMKSGVAAGIAVAEAFAEDPARAGNLLLVFTPDEENRSRGIRAVRDALPRLARQWDIDIVGAVNLDASSDLGDGASGRSVFLGSVGKLLPFAYVLGRSAHAGYPFEGVSATLIASEIVRRVEVNAALAERAHGQAIAPPVCLSARDGRERYDVTMPDRMWLAFNVLTQERTPAAVLALFTAEVHAATAHALVRYAELGALHGGATAARFEPRVLTFAELRRLAGGTAPHADAGAVDAADPLKITPHLCEQLVRRAGLEGPAVVVGFASLHYPAVHLDTADPLHARLRESGGQAARETATRYGTSIGFGEYFAGISDMSFLGSRAAGLEFVAENTPAADFIDRPAEEVLLFPVVNIGPWGREYHQKLERVHAAYAFEVLPALLSRLVALLFADQASDG